MSAMSSRSNIFDNLIDYLRYLERRVRELEIECATLRRELNYYKSEMEKMLTPPLIEAIVLEVLDNERAIVKSTTGPNLIVYISKNIDVESLLPGTHVALNQRGSTIVEVF